MKSERWVEVLLAVVVGKVFGAQLAMELWMAGQSTCQFTLKEETYKGMNRMSMRRTMR